MRVDDRNIKRELWCIMVVSGLTSLGFLAISVQLLFGAVLGTSLSDHPVAVLIESPKQNERIYYYNSEDPIFNATVRLFRHPSTAVGALILNVYFQGSLVAEVAAESDTVVILE
jgi:hypothetical protein